MSKVSFYSSVKQATSNVTLDIDDIMTSIHIGEYKDRVEAIRREKDKKKRARLKTNLPAFTGSGTFKKRGNNSLIEHSGRIIIDLDHIEDVNEAKAELGADPFVEYAFTSCGGEGLALVFKIDPDKHDQSFTAIREYIESKYNYEVDKAVKEVARLRFVSYDPDLIHNPGADVFQVFTNRDVYDADRIKNIIATNLNKAGKGQKHYFLVRNSRLAGGFIAGGLIDEDEARDFLRAEIQKKNIDNKAVAFKTIDDGIAHGKRDPITAEKAQEQEERHKQHTAAIREVYSFAHTINRAGRKWSETDVTNVGETNGVNAEEVRRIFKQVFADCKDEFGIDEAPEIDKVELFLTRNYEFLYNEVTQVREYREKCKGDFVKVNYDTIWRRLAKSKFKFPADKVKALLRSDFVETYNPFEMYFDSLPKFNLKGGQDPIDELAQHVTTTTPEFWRVQFKKALVRQIACALDSYVNRIVVVLVSETQNNGKSTFIRFLNPFGLEYYTESPLQNTKDTEFAFAENFIYNLEELSSLSNTDVNQLKAIISKAAIKERKPYAQDAEAHPRRCTFWSSTNKTEFLTDSSNTRWLVFTVESIDWGYSKKIDINEVYAQAFALYRDPEFNFELTAEEQEKRDFINKGYEIVDTEKELIMLHFKKAAKGDGTFVSNADIIQALNEYTDGKVRLNTRYISKDMVQLGFARDLRKVNGHPVRGFWVHKYVNSAYTDNDDQNLTLEERIKKDRETRFKIETQGASDVEDDQPF